MLQVKYARDMRDKYYAFYASTFNMKKSTRARVLRTGENYQVEAIIIVDYRRKCLSRIYRGGLQLEKFIHFCAKDKRKIISSERDEREVASINVARR